MATYYAKDGLTGGTIDGAQPVTSQRLVAKAFNFVITSNLTTTDTVVLAKLPKYATVLGFVIEVPVDASATTVNCNIGTTSSTGRFAANFNFASANMRISSFTGFDNTTANCAVIGGSLPYQILNTTANTGITVDENFIITPQATWTATVDGSAYFKGFVLYNCDESWTETNSETH